MTLSVFFWRILAYVYVLLGLLPVCLLALVEGLSSGAQKILIDVETFLNHKARL